MTSGERQSNCLCVYVRTYACVCVRKGDSVKCFQRNKDKEKREKTNIK